MATQHDDDDFLFWDVDKFGPMREWATADDAVRATFTDYEPDPEAVRRKFADRFARRARGER